MRKTIGFDDRGYPIYDTIDYTATREEGLIILARYNDDPWDIDKSKITFDELYKLWEDKKLPKLGASNKASLKSAYNHCSALRKKSTRKSERITCKKLLTTAERVIPHRAL